MIANEWSVRIAAGHDILVNGRFDPEAEASPNLGDRQDRLLHNFFARDPTVITNQRSRLFR